MSGNYRRSAYRSGRSRSRRSARSDVSGPLKALAALGLLYLAFATGALEAVAGWFGQAVTDRALEPNAPTP